MPGAPNRPPEVAASPVPPPAAEPARAVLRRLAPSRIALHLDPWKGNPSAELLDPLDRAARLYAEGDLAGAAGALDQLSTRLAEPRWPTLPRPFRDLRVTVTVPQPPAWDPENALPAEEKASRRRRRDAELQRDLAHASLAWAKAHGIAVDDLEPARAQADSALASPGVPEEFWPAIDSIWSTLLERVPAPRRAGRPAAAPGPS